MPSNTRWTLPLRVTASAPRKGPFSQSFPSPSFVPRRRRSGFWRVGEGRIEIGIGGGDDTSLRCRPPFCLLPLLAKDEDEGASGRAQPVLVTPPARERVTVCVLIHHSATEGKKECASRRGWGRTDGRREQREISAENLPTAFASRPARLPPLRNWRTDSGKRN